MSETKYRVDRVPFTMFELVPDPDGMEIPAALVETYSAAAAQIQSLLCQIEQACITSEMTRALKR